MKSVFSVDVEDWFHILDLPTTPSPADWDTLPSRVERNFTSLLDLFDEHQVRVTCFFLGWVGKRFPHLVKDAAKRGHEIASHGFVHQLVYQMTPEAFYQDAVQSRQILEDISGTPLWGYRSAGFSVTQGTEWFFDKLIEAGYVYDSSIFPAARSHGGLKGGKLGPYWIKRDSGNILEFPVSVTEVMGTPLCFFGGGYLRFFPYAIIRKMAHRVLEDSRPVIFYVHPREIDTDHPRLPMNWMRRFKSYVNLKSTRPKVARLMGDFSLTSFEQIIREGIQGVVTREEAVKSLSSTLPVLELSRAAVSSREN